MVDELAEFGLGAIFRFFKAIIKDILFDIFCYVVGWCFLKLISFGCYPPVGLIEGLKEDQSDETVVSIVGLVLVLGLCYLCFSW